MLKPALGALIARSSGMSLILTSRFGCTISSFISERRSVPPASTSASAQLVPSNAAACSFVVGLAYSNPRIAASLLFQSFEHSIRSEWQRRYANTDGVCYRVRDHGAWRTRGRVAEPDHPPLVISFSGHHVTHEFADVTDPGELVEFHVRVEHLA